MRRWLAGPQLVLLAMAIGTLVGVGFAFHLRTPAGLLIGAYLASLLLLLRVIAAQLLRVPHELGVSRRVLRGKTAALVPLVAFVSLSVLRERGGFDVAWNRATAERSSNSHVGFSTSSQGGPVPVLRGRLASCLLPTDSSSITHGFSGFVRCAGPGAPIVVNVSLTASDASCYTPLYKSAVVSYSAFVDVGASSPTGTVAGTISIQGSVQLTMKGIGSCRAFNEQVGREIGADVVTQINQFIQQH